MLCACIRIILREKAGKNIQIHCCIGMQLNVDVEVREQQYLKS